MSAANRDLTFAGVIVVAPGVFLRAEDHEADELITNEQKTALDALHLRKIDLAQDGTFRTNAFAPSAARRDPPCPPASADRSQESCQDVA